MVYKFEKMYRNEMKMYYFKQWKSTCLYYWIRVSHD